MKTDDIENLTIDQLKKALASTQQEAHDECCIAPEPISTHIVVLDRGFIYVGNPEWSDDKTFLTLTNCRNIRAWGTTKGLGELTTGPLSQTKLDEVGVIIIPTRAIIHLILCKKNW
jgi:hypothetical protein